MARRAPGSPKPDDRLTPAEEEAIREGRVADNNPAGPGSAGFAGFFGAYFLLFIAIVVVALVVGVYWIAVMCALAAAGLVWWIRHRLRRANAGFFDWW
jgi:Flp pilus assembly protein TadB